MKAITLASIISCMALGCGAAAALEVRLGGSLGAGLAGEATIGGIGLGVDATASLTAGTNADGASSTSHELSASLSGSGSTSASPAAEDEIDTVIRLIVSSHWSANALANVATVDGAVHDVGAWVDAGNEAALAAALDSKAGEIAQLQAALGANAAIDAWLGEHGVEPADVVAIGVAADGSLAVFTH